MYQHDHLMMVNQSFVRLASYWRTSQRVLKMKIFQWFGHQERERRQAYQNWAAEHPGWTYRDGHSDLWKRYTFLALLRQELLAMRSM